MSQRNTKQKSKRPISQPSVVAHFEEIPPLTNVSISNSPPPSPVQHPNPSPSLQDSDSEWTISASVNNASTPQNSTSYPTDDQTMIQPDGTQGFVQSDVHTKIIGCITRILPEAYITFNSAPKSMKDIWFNEFKKLHKWNPNDETAIRKIFEKKGAKIFSDMLGEVRKNLAKGNGHPVWMTGPVYAQYRCMWEKDEFKKLCEKNKKNRNSDCGGMGPSLHTAGSIPIAEHRRRYKEKHGVEPSHAVLYQSTHKRKKTDEFVCKKAQKVMEDVTQLQQTQPELGDENVWYEATGGVKKGGRVTGFGSDTEHYFPQVVRQRKSNSGQSSSHTACEEQIRELKQENKMILELYVRILERLERHPAASNANQQCSQSSDRAGSHEDSGVGLDDLGLNDDTQSPS